jgi:hypothetical protein
MSMGAPSSSARSIPSTREGPVGGYFSHRSGRMSWARHRVIVTTKDVIMRSNDMHIPSKHESICNFYNTFLFLGVDVARTCTSVPKSTFTAAGGSATRPDFHNPNFPNAANPTSRYRSIYRRSMKYFSNNAPMHVYPVLMSYSPESFPG